ncbi:MAG: transcriptional regulator GcvA [Hyphomicrobiales bacterium]|nr:transcriptional regulator GcvA [Hyphomicrobiales bacterium]
MQRPMPQLNALRAFEAAARHLSLTRAGQELHVTPGALSHQIRGLEELLGLKLFERGVRSIALTRAGLRLYPGLRAAFSQIRDAVEALGQDGNERALVISTPPGFTSKWLAPRLYRFSAAHPDIDARVSSSMVNANFVTDGVDIAVRNMPAEVEEDPELSIEPLVDMAYVPVCSPKLIKTHGPIRSGEALRAMPLIHDESLGSRPGLLGWADWFAAAGITGVDLSRGLRFTSTDHALDATIEGAGVLLTHVLLAYDELRTGRLLIPFPRSLGSTRVYSLVYPRVRAQRPNLQAFRSWIKKEMDALDWQKWRARLALTTQADQGRPTALVLAKSGTRAEAVRTRKT